MLIRLLLPQVAWDELSYQGSIFLQPGIWSSQKFVNRSTSMASKPQVFNVFLWPRCQLEVSPRKVWYLFYVIQSESYCQWSKTTTGIIVRKRNNTWIWLFQNRRSPGAIREQLSDIVSNKIAGLLLLLLVQR